MEGSKKRHAYESYVPLEQDDRIVGLDVVLSLRGEKNKKPHRFLQPASTLSIIGSTLDAATRQTHRLCDWIAEQFEALGGSRGCSRVLGSNPAVMVATPELFEDVWKSQLDIFPKGKHEVTTFEELFGKGTLPCDGKEWCFHRKTASNVLSLQMMKDVISFAVFGGQLTTH